MAQPGYFGLLKETFNDWLEDESMQMAAALAYYTVFSLAPLLILAITIASLLYHDQQNIQDWVNKQVTETVGPQAGEFIQTALQNSNRPGSGRLSIATIVSLVVLLFGASGVFGQLQSSLNRIWEVRPKPNQGIMGMIRTRLLSFSMILGIGFLLLVSLILSTVLHAFSDALSARLPGGSALAGVTDIVVSFALITLLFALIFKVLPDVKIGWKDVWLGAVLTAVLFTLGKYLLGLYLGKMSIQSSYGAAGSLVVLLLWIYYSSLILFFGAEFTQVYARHSGSAIEPDQYAVRLHEETVPSARSGT